VSRCRELDRPYHPQAFKRATQGLRRCAGRLTRALEAAGARRLRNESFFSAPQLKRDSLGSPTTVMAALKFANDGGPLIALDAALAAGWNGNRSDDYRDPIPPGSDYERACNAGYPAELLTVGAGSGVVIRAREGLL